jgi:transglutaminase-like putative cysteine protease
VVGTSTPRVKHFLSTGVVASLLLGGLALLPRPARGEEAPAPAARTFAFAYEAKFPAPAAGATHLDAWVPLPIEDGLQAVADLKVTATQDGKDVPVQQTKEEVYGNRFAYVGLDKPKGEVVLRWTARVTRTEDVGQDASAVNPRFREADRLLPITGRAADLARELGVTEGADLRARGHRIYDSVLSTMVYDKVAEGWGRGDFDRACEVGKGNCTDFHAKFMGIARAAGIPARFTIGIPITRDPKGSAGGYHCWAHFFDGAHWIPVDISEAQKIAAKDPAKAQWFFGHLDADRLSLTVGRDVNYAPKQKGETPLFIVYPYAEVDGKAVAVPKENRSFTWDAP